MTIEKAVKWLNEHKIPVRLLLSVAAGIATSMVLSVATHEILYLDGKFPPLFKPNFDNKLVTIELVYHSVYAIIAAFVTAKFAREKAKKAVFALGTKEAIMWVIGTLLLWKHNPPWYNITKALMGVPLAVFGGYIYRTYLKKPEKEPRPKRSAVKKA